MTKTRTLTPLMAAMALVAGCADQPEISSVESPGILNGILNGLFHTEGLSALLAAQCPLLHERLLVDGELTAPFDAAFAEEIVKPICDRFMFYTAEVMLSHGETLTLTAGAEPVASYTGVMGLENLIAQAYPQYEFTQHGFLPGFKIARVLATQVYAALTNGITRTVSFKTNVPALDAHRTAIEDTWTRELAQLVPATPQAITAMLTEPGFLARLPDFFEPCDPHLTNYDYLQQVPICHADALAFAKCPPSPPPPPQGNCPVPIVVHGNDEFDEDVIPGRSCRILQPGETIPPGSMLVGDVIVPEEGCPLIYYKGRTLGETIYDDRARNPSTTDDGCDFVGPTESDASNCNFHIHQNGMQISPERIATWVFNVQPLAPVAP